MTSGDTSAAGITSAQRAARLEHLHELDDDKYVAGTNRVLNVFDNKAPCPRYVVEHFRGTPEDPREDRCVVDLADDLAAALGSMTRPPIGDLPYTEHEFWKSVVRDLDTGEHVDEHTHAVAYTDLDVMLRVVAAKLRAGKRPKTALLREGDDTTTVYIDYGSDHYGGNYAQVLWVPRALRLGSGCEPDWYGALEGDDWGAMTGFRFLLGESDEDDEIDEDDEDEA